MATLQDLDQSVRESEAQETPQGFIETFGAAQDMFLRNFNTGIARLAGIPSAITELVGKTLPPSQSGLRERATGQREDAQVSNIFPSQSEIQDFAAEQGLAFPAGEEPQDLASRIVQNIGTTAPLLPFFGPVGVAAELMAAGGGAAGGKILESTGFGKRNPELARGIGELGGGLGASGVTGVMRSISNFFTKGGTLGLGTRVAKKTVKGLIPTPGERASARLLAEEATPDIARENLRLAQTTPEGQLLTPAQAAGTKGATGLSRAVEQESPAFAEFMATQRIESRDALKAQFIKSGSVDDSRAFIESNLTKRANEANRILSKIETSKNPAALSTNAENRIRIAFNESTAAENRAWNNLPEADEISGANLISQHEEHLANLTEGADPSLISTFSKSKLGTFKKVRDEDDIVSGGALFNPKKETASAKAVHQFYSALGEKMSRLARQGGNRNKIRLLRELREAALEDLDAAGLGGEYGNAIRLSKELNEKFTRGQVGKILGFGSGETPLATRALDQIVGTGGETAREGVAQALRGAPKAKKDIEDFLKTQFLSTAQNRQNNKININSGNRFIKNFEEVLDDFFPGLKKDFQGAIDTQRSVDDFLGVPQVANMSPLAKERSAAALFLGRDPGEEMAAFIRNKSAQRTTALKDLVKLSKTDNTGKAFAGLQNGFTREILNHGNTATSLGGDVILRRLKELEPVMLRTGLFNKNEISRLKTIADTFKKIDFEAAQQPFKGGIIDDVPSRLLSTSMRIIGVRLASKVNRVLTPGRADIGGSLQTANIASKLAQDFANSLTNDKARALLIEAVKDPKLMDDLLSGVLKATPGKRKAIFSRLLSKADELIPNIPRVPVSAVAPGTASLASEQEDQALTKELLLLLNR